MPTYLWQLDDWPEFRWDKSVFQKGLERLHFAQGGLSALLKQLGVSDRLHVATSFMAKEIVQNHAIEGVSLDYDTVLSSVALHLGLETAESPKNQKIHEELATNVMLDAISHCHTPLSAQILFDWHRQLFPDATSGLHTIDTGMWRKKNVDVVSGHEGKYVVRFTAPQPEKIPQEMDRFFSWFNQAECENAIAKAALAHLWFVTIHPFEDGNGRFARIIMDMVLACDSTFIAQHYSMSSAIINRRREYYAILENVQNNGSMDVTPWMAWFCKTLEKSILDSQEVVEKTLHKALFWNMHKWKGINKTQEKVINKILSPDKIFEGQLTEKKYAALANCTKEVAQSDLLDLVQKGIFAKIECGKSITFVPQFEVINIEE